MTAPDDPAFAVEGPAGGGDDRSPEEFAELRELLVGPERGRIDGLSQRLDDLALDPEELAEHLPEAIALRAGRDRQLARALAPTVESAISESVRRNPREIATAIFPVLGPAIRKAIAQTMAGLVQSINSAIEHSLSPRGIRWRLEAWRTGVPYAQIVIKHCLVYRVEQVFLIHADTGLLLAHVAVPELKVADADLVSSMLTAIQDFVSDSFQPEEEGGKLRTFSVGELSVLVEQGPRAVVAAVVRGQAPDEYVVRLQDALETIHSQMGIALADFDGDTGPFDVTRPLLEECLHIVLTTDENRRTTRGRRAWLLWLAPVAAVVLLLTWTTLRAARRWDDVIGRLRAEPGVVLVEARRDGDQWLLQGLRDPLAADPAAVIAGLGIDSSDVRAVWRPYLSLEPPLVLERARRQLAAPATVTLGLRGDSLVVAGTAPLAWTGRAAVAAPPPGVAGIDLAGVAAVLPPELAALQRAVEERRVLFEIGSAALGREAARTVAAAAQAMERLGTAVADHGFAVRLELVGRTDATGSDSTNQSLSQLRADAVAARLAALGFAGSPRVTGVGTSQPVPAEDDADRARLNRSVSLALRLVPLPRAR